MRLAGFRVGWSSPFLLLSNHNVMLLALPASFRTIFYTAFNPPILRDYVPYRQMLNSLITGIQPMIYIEPSPLISSLDFTDEKNTDLRTEVWQYLHDPLSSDEHRIVDGHALNRAVIHEIQYA